MRDDLHLFVEEWRWRARLGPARWNVPAVRGIILAGGEGTRLLPMTRVTNKHLLPVHGVPMVYWPLRTFLVNVIRDIMVITGREHAGEVMNLLGSGREYGCRFTYRVQDRAGGIAEAIGLAEDFARSEPLAVILGDSIYDPPPAVVLPPGAGAHVYLREVADPRAYGVPIFEGPEPATLEADSLHSGRRSPQIRGIVEKPAQPLSRFAVTGLYVYEGVDLWGIIRGLKPSARGELEVTDVNNAYIARGEMVHTVLGSSTYWGDAGSLEGMKDATDVLATRRAVWNT